MIIGSGLLAKAFLPVFGQSECTCIYAAGVSNARCCDVLEFDKENHRLTDALRNASDVDVFIYFGTCSVSDSDALNTPYVQHKIAMERLVACHPRHLILRLPQLAGNSPNPHTLLNYLYARVSRGESFALWRNAQRNIIDVDDVLAITRELISKKKLRNVIINVANRINYPMIDIITAMERALGKRAIYEVSERGSSYHIETLAIHPYLVKAGVIFDDDYLQKVITKYYSGSKLAMKAVTYRDGVT